MVPSAPALIPSSASRSMSLSLVMNSSSPFSGAGCSCEEVKEEGGRDVKMKGRNEVSSEEEGKGSDERQRRANHLVEEILKK